MRAVIFTLLAIICGALAIHGVRQQKEQGQAWGGLLAVICTLLGVLFVLLSGKLIIVLILLIAVVIWSMREYKTKGAAWAQPVATTCSVLATCLALLSVVYQLGGCGQKSTAKRAMATQEHYALAQARVAGEYLGSAQAGAQVVTIRTAHDRFGDGKIEALQEGAGSACTFVADEKLGAGESGAPGAPMGPAMMPFMEGMMMFRRADLDRIIAKYPKCDLIVSFVGLPYDLFHNVVGEEKEKDPPEPWNWAEAPKFLLMQSGIVGQERALIEAGYVVGLVHHKPGYRYAPGQKPPKDLQEAFDERFLLVTKENLAEMDAKYPGLLPQLVVE